MKLGAAIALAMLAMACSDHSHGDGLSSAGMTGGGTGGNGQAGMAAMTNEMPTPSTMQTPGATGDMSVDAGTGMPAVDLMPDVDAGPAEPQLPEPSFASCAIPAADFTAEVQGGWSGTVHLAQNLLGARKEKDLEVDLYLDERSAPRRHLAAIGYLGDGWVVSSEDPNTNSLVSFLGAGGNGTLWGHNGYEADGPANELTLADSCVEATDTLFAWRYTITYHVSDLVHRRLYGYAESGAPLVTLAAQEIHAVIDGRLYLRASSEGMSAEGEPVAYTMTGTLSRISR